MLTMMEVARVLSYYNIGTLQSTNPACRGYVNETAFAQTTEGQFVVRRNHRRLSETVHRYRHQLINHLREKHFPTPALMRTRDGDTLLELDGRFYEVMTFIRGEDFNHARPQQVVSVGATLARYHTIVHDFPAPPDDVQMRYAPQGILGLAEMILERDFMGDLHECLSWYDMRTNYLRTVLPNETYAALPHVPIHGDMHRDNVLMAQDNVIAMLDYDQVAWDTPLADLADALVAFASVDKPDAVNWGVFDGPLDEERAEHLLTGYASVAPLSAAEVSMLPVLLEVMWLKSELGRVISTPEGASDYHLAVLEQGQMLSQWMDERRERLREQWTRIGTGQTRRVTASAA
jgi:homoserine kinase type II